MARHSWKESVPHVEHENPLLEDQHSALEEAKAAKERYERQLKGDMKRLLATSSGKRFMKRLYSICRAGALSAVLDKNGSIDMNGTLINEGRKAVWLDVQRMMDDEDMMNTLATRGYRSTPSEDEEDDAE